MNWNLLLQAFRSGDTTARKPESNNARSLFEQDYDRVIFSTPFRRLQDKTQVIPLPEHDFVHNRLTHSIEVSSVGRSLGKIAGEKLLEKYPDQKFDFTIHDTGAIVAAASLAHDIGNPPFGHSGEDAIGEYFLYGGGKRYKEKLTEAEWNDLTRFEGNANGFRILTRYGNTSNGGLRLTFPTLAAFTKYPKESLPVYLKPETRQKKYGFFQSEKLMYSEMAEKLNLTKAGENGLVEYLRHPLAYLVEAADDICYRIIDFEDGLRLGWIDSAKGEELLKSIAREKFYPNSYIRLSSFEEKAGYLRAVAINSLISEMADVFVANEEKICSGRFEGSLLDYSAYSNELKEIKKLSIDKVYNARSVVEIEAAGFEIIAGLLDYFVNAVDAVCEDSGGRHSRKIAALLPDHLANPSQELKTNIYLRLLSVCEYVAGLTDRHAISIFRKLKGIELPG